MNVKRLLGWIFIPFAMVILEWKKINSLLRIYGFFWLAILALGILAAAFESKPAEQKQQVKEQVVEKENKKEIYPASILKSIQDLQKSKENKMIRYKLFDQEVSKTIPNQISKADLNFYKKFVLDDYKNMTFDYVKSLSDSELLKIIYRNRPVDLYYVYKEIYDSPLGGVAFNVIQIAKEQYQGTLNENNYKIFKQTMDKHFNNM